MDEREIGDVLVSDIDMQFFLSYSRRIKMMNHDVSIPIQWHTGKMQGKDLL